MSQYVILRYSEGSGSDEPRCFGVPQHDSSEKPRRRIPRAIWKILRIAALVYIGLIIVLATAQTWFIFPGAATQGRRDAIVRPSEGAELVKLKAKTGDDVAALFGYAMTPDGQPHPSRATRPS